MANSCSLFFTLEVKNEKEAKAIRFDYENPDMVDEGREANRAILKVCRQAYEQCEISSTTVKDDRVYLTFEIETAWSSQIEDLLDVIWDRKDYALIAYYAEELGSNYLVCVGNDYFCMDYCYIDSDKVDENYCDYKNADEVMAALGLTKEECEASCIFAETEEERGKYIIKTINNEIQITLK